jgi:hypothetical protein
VEEEENVAAARKKRKVRNGTFLGQTKLDEKEASTEF